MGWSQEQGARKDGAPMHRLATAWGGLQGGTMTLARQVGCWMERC